jgi:hypothetical protein
LYNPKFAYHELSRTSEEGQRLYLTPDGRKVPSVTTILDRTKPAEKKAALEQWRRNVGHERAQQITTEAASRGTRMHAYLEHYVKTGEVKGTWIKSNEFCQSCHGTNCDRRWTCKCQ